MSIVQGEPHPKRISMKKDEIEALTKEQLIEKWFQQDKYIDFLETKPNDADNSELVSLRESEEKLKQQQLEATRRENILVMRLTTKEQEMQEYANQIQELKQGQIPTVAQLRSALLDPAVNLMFERLRKELESTKARLEETQNELSAWKFTPDSNTGKRLMAKCRLLYQENEELGKMISSGRMAKLEGDLALQRNFSEEMKKSQNELDEFLLELDEDVEGMQNTIYYLQKQLKESKEQISRLQHDVQRIGIREKDVDTTIRTGTPTILLKNDHVEKHKMANGKDSPTHNIVSNDLLVDNGHPGEQLHKSLDQKQDVADSKDVMEASKSIWTSVVVKQEPIDLDDFQETPGTKSLSDTVKECATTHSCGTPKDNIEVDNICQNKHKETSDPKTTHSLIAPSPLDNQERLKRMRDNLEETDTIQSPKRPKHNGDTSVIPKQESPCVEVDTDTEVQVAEMLVCWAVANKGRMESQSAEQTCQIVGNGEVDDSSSVSE